MLGNCQTFIIASGYAKFRNLDVTNQFETCKKLDEFRHKVKDCLEEVAAIAHDVGSTMQTNQKSALT